MISVPRTKMVFKFVLITVLLWKPITGHLQVWIWFISLEFKIEIFMQIKGRRTEEQLPNLWNWNRERGQRVGGTGRVAGVPARQWTSHLPAWPWRVDRLPFDRLGMLLPRPNSSEFAYFVKTLIKLHISFNLIKIAKLAGVTWLLSLPWNGLGGHGNVKGATRRRQPLADRP